VFVVVAALVVFDVDDAVSPLLDDVATVVGGSAADGDEPVPDVAPAPVDDADWCGVNVCVEIVASVAVVTSAPQFGKTADAYRFHILNGERAETIPNVGNERSGKLVGVVSDHRGTRLLRLNSVPVSLYSTLALVT